MAEWVEAKIEKSGRIARGIFIREPGVCPFDSTIQAFISLLGVNEAVSMVFNSDSFTFVFAPLGVALWLLSAIKDVGVDTLADTIRKAARSEAVLHPQVAARVIRELQGLRAEARSLAAELSERELEVLTLIANGARGPHPPGWMREGHVMRIVVRIELFPSLFPLD